MTALGLATCSTCGAPRYYDADQPRPVFICNQCKDAAARPPRLHRNHLRADLRDPPDPAVAAALAAADALEAAVGAFLRDNDWVGSATDPLLEALAHYAEARLKVPS